MLFFVKCISFLLFAILVSSMLILETRAYSSARTSNHNHNNKDNYNSNVKRPLIILPGFGASILHAFNKHNSSEPPIRVFETFEDTQRKLETYLLLKYCEDCLIPESINQDYEIRSPLDIDHGLYGVDIMNPGEQPVRAYFHAVIEFLKNDLGYEPGKNLFAFPYDWRLNTTVHTANFVKYVDRIRTATDADQVDVMSHSFGGILFKETILNHPHYGRYFHTYISIATPWKGTGMVFVAPLFVGSTMGNREWDLKTVRALQLASPAIYQIISHGYYSSLTYDNGQPTFSYTMNGETVTLDIQQTFDLLDTLLKNNTYEVNGKSYHIPFSMKRIRDVKHVALRFMNSDQEILRNQPRYVYNIVGVMVDTPLSALIKGEIDNLYDIPNKGVLETSNKVSGDGIVSYESGIASGFKTLKTTYKRSTHNAILRSAATFEDLRQFLGHSCPFEGNWIITAEDIRNPAKSLTFNLTMHTDYGIVNGDLWDMKGSFSSNVWTGEGVGLYGPGYFTITQAKDCQTFNGTWNYPWLSNDIPLVGKRIAGSECTAPEPCRVTNGAGVRKCVDGTLAFNCLITKCNQGYTMTIGQPYSVSECVLSQSGVHKMTIIVISCTLAGVVVFVVASLVIVTIVKLWWDKRVASRNQSANLVNIDYSRLIN